MVFLVQRTWGETVPVGYCETQAAAREAAGVAADELLAAIRDDEPGAVCLETGHPGMPVFYITVRGRRVANVAVLVVQKLD